MAAPPKPDSGFTYTPPKAKGKSKGAPSTNATLALILNDPRFKSYRGSIQTIQQKAKLYGWNPVELLLTLAATGRQGTAPSIDALRDAFTTRNQFSSLNAWAASTGLSFQIDPEKTLSAVTKKGGYTLPYVPVASSTPQDTAQKAVDTAQAKAKITSTDQWVIVKRASKTGTVLELGFAPVTQFAPDGTPVPVDANGKPLKNVLKSGGNPVTKSSLDKATSDYQDYFTAYSNKGTNPLQVANLLHKGLSSYAIEQLLSKQPGFKNSQIYKAHAPAIIGLAKDMFGQGWKPDQNFISQAIAGNWDQGTITQKLKERPEYLKGPQYRQTTASLSNVYQSIMGVPDQQALVNIHEAAVEGWSPDQLAAWLRGTPNYKYSPEAQSYALHIAGQLGLITGKVPTLTPGASTAGTIKEPAQPGPPNSTRIAGTPKPPAAANNLGVGSY